MAKVSLLEYTGQTTSELIACIADNPRKNLSQFA
jgi:hypothetical protein